MKLNKDDEILLKELCEQCHIHFEKVIKLLETEKEFEFKDRRTGIYDALREIVKSSPTEEIKQ